MSRSSFKIRCLTVPKNFVGENFCVSQNFWYRNFFWITRRRGLGGLSRFPFKNFLSQSAKKLRRGTLLCFRKFQVTKNFLPKRGILRFSKEELSLDSSEKLCRRTLLWFKKLVVSKNLWITRVAGEWRTITTCRLNHSAQNFRRGTF